MPTENLPHLEIDSHVVIQLGAELVTDSEQALLELVKNAYDGDATRCTIVIEPDWLPDEDHPWREHLQSGNEVPGPVGRIVVEDNGDGITENAVRNGWLLISASLKRATGEHKTKTARGRTPVGDKGLGRLATMRLGDVLYLATKTKLDRVARTVAFAWSAFHSGSKLTDIPVVTGTQPGLNKRDKGTDVAILGLQEPGYWQSEQNIQGVISKLSSLVSPFKRLQDFNVNIRFNDQVRDLQALSAEALNHASAKFSFEYIEQTLTCKAWFAKSLFRGRSGQKEKERYEELLSDVELPKVIEYIRNSKRLANQGLSSLLEEPGGWLFSLEDSFGVDTIPSDPKLVGAKDPGPFKGEIYYVLFNEPTRLALQASGVAVDMLQNMTSIGMFRDGFRVRMDDDWLQISRGVTSGGFFQLRPKNVIGFFEISNENNPSLIEKSDREAFVDNEAWRGFRLLAERAKKFANDSLEAVRTSFDAYKKERLGAQPNKPQAPQENDPASALKARRDAATESLNVARARSVSIAKVISGIGTSLSAKTTASSAKALTHIKAEFESLRHSFQEFQRTLEEASRNAAEGFQAAERVVLSNEEVAEQNLRLIDAAAVGLSARGLTHEINAHLAQIEKGLASFRRFNRSTGQGRLDDAIDKVAGATRELKKSVSSINPLLVGSRSLKDNFFVGDAIGEFIELRGSRLHDLAISTTITGGKGPKIRFSKARFNQILENLMQNSIYWIEEHSSKDKTVRRTITIEMDRRGFTWWDGAKGVRKAVEETLFEPYVTDKPESRGQGLGLFLVTAFLGSEKCHILLGDERNQWGRRYRFRVDLRGATVQ